MPREVKHPRATPLVVVCLVCGARTETELILNHARPHLIAMANLPMKYRCPERGHGVNRWT